MQLETGFEPSTQLVDGPGIPAHSHAQVPGVACALAVLGKDIKNIETKRNEKKTKNKIR